MMWIRRHTYIIDFRPCAVSAIFTSPCIRPPYCQGDTRLRTGHDGICHVIWTWQHIIYSIWYAYLNQDVRYHNMKDGKKKSLRPRPTAHILQLIHYTKHFYFEWNFYWSFFPRAHLTKIQHWFRSYLGGEPATKDGLIYWRIYAPLGPDVITVDVSRCLELSFSDF